MGEVQRNEWSMAWQGHIEVLFSNGRRAAFIYVFSACNCVSRSPPSNLSSLASAI